MERPDFWGCSPLWTAAGNGHLETVQILVNAGAKLDRLGRYGASPLTVAVFKGRLSVVSLKGLGSGCPFGVPTSLAVDTHCIHHVALCQRLVCVTIISWSCLSIAMEENICNRRDHPDVMLA